MKWMIFVLALGLSGCATANKKADTSAQDQSPATTAVAKPADLSVPAELRKVSCTKGDEVRALEVVKQGEGCSLDYTKSGKTSAIASGVHGVHHCVSTGKKIRSKLEKAGYSCS